MGGPTGKDRGWEVRTVRNGAVCIAGKTYRPEQHHLAYDGRLDGLRCLFGRYWEIDHYLPFVNLWGTEENARSESADFGPECVDGTLPWMFWKCDE